ncbi:MAG: 2-oxoglutarate dehydrogenase complex dihydrolipoyllysine-residue succinyltransferase [Thermoflavifilum sp.]|nr:2-oxoglutarate dehydrogenase complex dihydrolipoyllysine-residue succinyltransferase [Thermoflavifilum sp.]
MQTVTVPPIGESISEVTIARWLKNDGDFVQQDEVIAEIESEKASFEIRAEMAGRLHILTPEGSDAQVGSTIAEIDTDVPMPASATSTAASSSSPVEQDSSPSDKAVTEATPEATPKAAKIASSIEVKVPSVGESIQQVTLAKWLKSDGERVELDEVIAELESEKASFELRAEARGLLHHRVAEGQDVEVGAVIAVIDLQADSSTQKPFEAAVASSEPELASSSPAHVSITVEPAKASAPTDSAAATQSALPRATPLAAALMAEQHLSPQEVKGTGPAGKIRRDDVRAALQHPGMKTGQALFSRNERRERMSNLRRTISRRLVEAKNATAMLTTFNEVDMSAIMQIRSQYKEAFKEKHGVNLGFMSFFTKACCYALQEWPAVNAYIDGDDIVYHDYCDISIAVSTPRGLVVPVIRNAESLSMAEIERKVLELATKAREGKLTIEEMTGGTFTITNGGVFGSLMSTPILNIPQAAILGMHKIQERPVVVNGQVVVRPMMYVALSYDHRIIDGRESVSFLVRVKELLENPQQLLFGKDPVKALLEL